MRIYKGGINMFKGIGKIFDISAKEIKRMTKTVTKINKLEEQTKLLTDVELCAKTEAFKQRLSNGETLDDILPEAFAVVREASVRVLNMRHYDVQLIGGLALHKGNIAEMRTGEGKTLVSTLPVYLNALSGNGVHVVTVNDYLAQRDAHEMGQVHQFLGLSVGVNTSGMTSEEKQAAYNCDVTYGTNNEFGFDYLRDNMVLYHEQKTQRGLAYAIIDEVDSVLIDEARTPLIISGRAEKSTSIYKKADTIAKKMVDERDYKYDIKTKNISLTEEGVEKAERYFGINNLYDISNAAINQNISQALKAHIVMKKDQDYVVMSGQVIIIDQFTGRMMEGRRYSDGLHQAIEAKERVAIQDETMTLATVTFQNYFRMYKKLAGMTGTARTEAKEFREIYNIDVITIPTNLPVKREDKVDVIFKTNKEKYEAIVGRIKTAYGKGQPVLLGTANIETSELLSSMLRKSQIPHYVLNAKQHEKEAEIIAQAGQKGSVTIATNMAGRGTDIKLGDGVVDLGGLMVIGTERHESRRIDNQLRGRSGRQGDPGLSVFYLSLEDDLMKRFGKDNLRSVMERLGVPEGEAIESKMVSKSIETAQRRVEGNNFDARKWVLKFDDVLREQREIIYTQRDEVLLSEDLKDLVLGMVNSTIENALDSLVADNNQQEWDLDSLVLYLNDRLFEQNELTVEELKEKTKRELFSYVMEKAHTKYKNKQKSHVKTFQEFEKVVLLRVIDSKWMDHIDSMHQLRQGIHLRSYAQTDPLREYQMEGFSMFEAMVKTIEEQSAMMILKTVIEEGAKRVEVVKVQQPSTAKGNNPKITKRK